MTLILAVFNLLLSRDIKHYISSICDIRYAVCVYMFLEGAFYGCTFVCLCWLSICIQDHGSKTHTT